MAKNNVNDYDSTANNNTDIQSINIAEGCAPANINNAIRELMADIKDLVSGAVTATSIKTAALVATTATVTSLVLGTGTATAVPSSRAVTAGLGLSGGGALSGDVSLALDVSDLTATATSAAGDYFPMYRTAATGTYKVLKSDLAGTTSAPGFVEIATEAEVQGLTATATVVAPAGLATIGVPILLETLTTTSGSSVATGTLPACRAFFIAVVGTSMNATATLRLAISDDNGSSYSGNVDLDTGPSASYARAAQIWVTGTGASGNKLVHSILGPSNADGNIQCANAVISSVTGTVNKFRFQASAGAFDAGAIYVYGVR